MAAADGRKSPFRLEASFLRRRSFRKRALPNRRLARAAKACKQRLNARDAGSLPLGERRKKQLAKGGPNAPLTHTRLWGKKVRSQIPGTNFQQLQDFNDN